MLNRKVHCQSDGTKDIQGKGVMYKIFDKDELEDTMTIETEIYFESYETTFISQRKFVRMDT